MGICDFSPNFVIGANPRLELEIDQLAASIEKADADIASDFPLTMLGRSPVSLFTLDLIMPPQPQNDYEIIPRPYGD